MIEEDFNVACIAIHSLHGKVEMISTDSKGTLGHPPKLGRVPNHKIGGLA
jgi:hypothetical protein